MSTPSATPEEFLAAAEDPEFNSVEPFVVSEGPHGFKLSDGAFVTRAEAEAAVTGTGWLGRLFAALLPCE